MSEMGSPGFPQVLIRSIVDPSPRLNTGVTSKTSFGFKILLKVGMVLVTLGVAYDEKFETNCASLTCLVVEFSVRQFFVGC